MAGTLRIITGAIKNILYQDKTHFVSPIIKIKHTFSFCYFFGFFVLFIQMQLSKV